MAERVEPASPRKIAVAAAVALLVAALLLVAVVLPAEYGIDLIGAGAALGLLGLAQEQPIALQDGEYRLDEASLSVGPGGWLEYTYRMEAGATMLFSWQATGPLNYNFHSAPRRGAARLRGELRRAGERPRARRLFRAVHRRARLVLGERDRGRGDDIVLDGRLLQRGARGARPCDRLSRADRSARKRGAGPVMAPAPRRR